MLIVRMLFQTAALMVVLALVLFWPAGTLAWPAGWAFIAEVGAFSLALSSWLAIKDPGLLSERLGPPIAKDQKGWDRLFMLAALVCVFGWFAIMGWDGGSAHRGAVPASLQVAGAVLIALCMGLCWLTFRSNTFAAPVVKVQAGRGHRVVTDGPYAIVRHPMYAGAVAYFLGVPLLLGSWIGLAMAPALVLGLAIRAVAEEAELRTSLVGYADYAVKVRFRLVPGVW